MNIEDMNIEYMNIAYMNIEQEQYTVYKVLSNSEWSCQENDSN